ncbi:uncharacterized protein [Amphiura filiformis]|uniref:uncharacterized protein n=1 Tax=Amphiura filiformis TaxID=82378 RepID=UPI003B224403
MASGDDEIKLEEKLNDSSEEISNTSDSSSDDEILDFDLNMATKYDMYDLKIKYSGDPEDDLDSFITKFSNYAALRDYTAPKAALALTIKIEGNASVFLESIPESDKDTVDKIKALLKENFEGDSWRWGIESKLLSRKQLTNETLDVYASDIMRWCRQVGKTDSEQMSIFVRGLLPSLRGFVFSKEPKTFRNALDAARLGIAVQQTAESDTSSTKTVENSSNSVDEVNVVKNIRYQYGKRVGNDKKVENKDVPTLPAEINLQGFKDALLTDTFASSMLNFLEHDKLPDDALKARNLLLQADQYYVHEGLLYHIWHTPAKRHMPERNTYQLYVPITFVDTVLNNCHDHVLAAHFGFQRTYSKIRQRYFWKGMYRDVDNWVRSCISCSQRKTHRHKVIAPMQIMKVPGAFQRVSVDILGPLPITTSGNRYVLCFTDHCTRWPILVPLKVTNASTIARAFYDNVICVHGCPETLLSDRGTNFLSKIVLEVCRIMRTQKLNTSSYHPQCNAIQERYNAVILDTISHYVNDFHTDWDQYITAIQFAYRTTPAENSVGFSPFFLLYGREARLPLDVTLTSDCNYAEQNLREHIHHLISQLEIARKISQRHAEQNQNKMKERFDESATEVPYQVGDSVWVYIPALQQGLSRKLQKFWSGPYLLVEQTGPVNFRVRNLENNKLITTPIHVNRMKFAYDRYVRPNNDTEPTDLEQRDPIPGLVPDNCPEDSFLPLLATQESEKTKVPIILGLPPVQDKTPEYVIEHIIRGRRYRNGRLEYLIKWRDFPKSRNTWEPETNLNAAALESLKTNPVKITGKL